MIVQLYRTHYLHRGINRWNPSPILIDLCSCKILLEQIHLWTVRTERWMPCAQVCQVVCVNRFFSRSCHSTRSVLPCAHPSTIGCARVPGLVSCAHPIFHRAPVPANIAVWTPHPHWGTNRSSWLFESWNLPWKSILYSWKKSKNPLSMFVG